MTVRRAKVVVAGGLILASGMARADDKPAALRPADSKTPTLYQVSQPIAVLPAPARADAEPRPATMSGGSAGVPAESLNTPALSCAAPGASAPTPVQSCKQKLQAYYLSDRLGVMPLGMSVNEPFRQQASNGVASRMTLYEYDFVCGTDKLNYRGKQRLRQISCWLSQNGFPVVVEYTPQTPALADARRLVVLNELHASSVAVPMERIIVGSPLAIPMQGIEAELIYQNQLLQTNDFGFPLYRSWYGAGGGGSNGGIGTLIGGGASGVPVGGGAPSGR